MDGNQDIATPSGKITLNGNGTLRGKKGNAKNQLHTLVLQMLQVMGTIINHKKIRWLHNFIINRLWPLLLFPGLRPAMQHEAYHHLSIGGVTPPLHTHPYTHQTPLNQKPKPKEQDTHAQARKTKT